MTTFTREAYEDALIHAGVKGMKWGVRKPEEVGTGRSSGGGSSSSSSSSSSGTVNVASAAAAAQRSAKRTKALKIGGGILLGAGVLVGGAVLAKHSGVSVGSLTGVAKTAARAGVGKAKEKAVAKVTDRAMGSLTDRLAGKAKREDSAPSGPSARDILASGPSRNTSRGQQMAALISQQQAFSQRVSSINQDLRDQDKSTLEWMQSMGLGSMVNANGEIEL